MTLAAALKKYGLLLLQDKKLPSAVGIITGEQLSGSWWSHPRANEIFRRLDDLECDAIATKLIAGKVPFVHRRLWPPLVALADEIGRERLARVDEEHTPSGKHVKRVTPFPDWAPADVRAAAAELSHDKARAALGSLAAVVLKSAATDPGGKTRPRSHT